MGRLFLLVLSLALCLAGTELLLRTAAKTTLGFDYNAENERFYIPLEFERNTTRNALGFLDVEVRPKRAGTQRVLLLGDSYVECYSVVAEKNVGQRLEAHLNAHSETNYQVISIGNSGWGQRDELKALEEYGPQLAPDIVMTLFLGFNDVENNSYTLKNKMRAQSQDSASSFHPGWARRAADDMPLFFFRSSVLNQLISHRLALLAMRRSSTDPRHIPIDYLSFRTPPDEEWNFAWIQTENLIEKTRKLAEKLGARYLVASASSPLGVLGNEAGLDVLVASYPAVGSFEWDFDFPDHRMAKICERKNVPFIALQPEFQRRTAAGSVLHWPYDGHWNADGNDLAGELTAAWMLQARP